jgi:uncharacterized protein (DUF2141 family)
MKQIIIVGAALLTLFGASAVAQNATEQTAVTGNSLSIQIQGVRTRTGQVMLSLCTAVEYDAGDRCAFGKIVPIRDIGAPIVIDNVPNGTFGVKLFHDVNGNGRLDANAMGIPREPYGFSNNARGRFGPAKFEDASFTIDKATTIAIRLN